MDIFYTILYAAMYNFVLLLFLVAALTFRKHGTGIFTVGVVMQGLAVFGAVQQMMQGTVRIDSILSIGFSVVLVVAGYYLIKRWKEEDEQTEEEQADSDQNSNAE